MNVIRKIRLKSRVFKCCTHRPSIRFNSTWSPIANVFNRLHDYSNVNILQERKGLFNVPELTSHEGFYALKEKCLLETDNLIQEITSSKRSRKMVEIFDEMSDTLCKVADLAEFIRLAHTSPLYARTAEVACNTVSGIVEKYFKITFK